MLCESKLSGVQLHYFAWTDSVYSCAQIFGEYNFYVTDKLSQTLLIPD
jgi:hypothetical protein